MTAEKLYDKWSFVEKDLDQDQWYVKLTGGKYHGVVYNYNSIKANETTESIDFDYEVVDWLDDNPHGEPEFNQVAGDILQLVLKDAMEAGDYVLGDKDESRSTDNTS